MVFSQILRSVNKNAAKTKNVDKEYAKQIDFKGLKFPVHKRDYAKRIFSLMYLVMTMKHRTVFIL